VDMWVHTKNDVFLVQATEHTIGRRCTLKIRSVFRVWSRWIIAVTQCTGV